MALHKLSTLKLKTTRPGRYPNGGNLFLKVSRNPTTGGVRRSWIFRYSRNGVERFMGLGSLDDVGLAEAREKAAAARKLHKDGEDPIKVRDAALTAKRVEKASEFRSGDNPARWKGHLENLLPRHSKRQKHFEAMPYTKVAAFIVGLGNDLSALALEFTILTAARTGEVMGARWTEVDFESKVWTVPAERTKRQRAHRFPLAPRALEILKSLPRSDARIFPLGHAGMLNRTLAGATVHGFRSSFRTWCSEQTNFPREIAEAALWARHWRRHRASLSTWRCA
jgi:integrase